MAKPRTFTTLPARAIGDNRLTALDLRCLAAISLHDGRSLAGGKGGGCYAKYSTLAAMVQTDMTNFSKVVSRLIKLEYLVSEKQQTDRRRTTLRVLPDSDDSWRADQPSAPDIVGETTNDLSSVVGEMTNHTAEIVGDGEHKNGSFSKQIALQKTSLKRGNRFRRNEEINSSEEAQRDFIAPRCGGFDSSKDGQHEAGKVSADTSVIRVSIYPLLPRSFPKLSLNVRLIKFEEAFEKIGRNAEVLEDEERDSWSSQLAAICSKYGGEPIGHHAERLLEEVMRY